MVIFREKGFLNCLLNWFLLTLPYPPFPSLILDGCHDWKSQRVKNSFFFLKFFLFLCCLPLARATLSASLRDLKAPRKGEDVWPPVLLHVVVPLWALGSLDARAGLRKWGQPRWMDRVAPLPFPPARGTPCGEKRGIPRLLSGGWPSRA